MVEDLKTQSALEENKQLRKSFQWAADEAKGLQKIQNRNEQHHAIVEQDLQMQTMYTQH